jgi:hypothetical protein
MKRIFAMVFAIAMLASACSGGDGLAIETSAGDSGASGDSATPADSSSEDGTAEDATAEESSSSSSSSSGGDWCGRAGVVNEEMKNLESPDELESFRLVQALLSDAPNEIKDDVAILFEGMDLMVEAVELIDAGGDIMPEAFLLFEEFESGKYAEASNNVDNYLEETCGLDMSEFDG